MTLKIFDMDGSENRVLADGVMNAGRHEIHLRPHGKSGGIRVVRIVMGKNRQEALLFSF